MTEEEHNNLKNDSNYYYDLLLKIKHDKIAYDLELEELEELEE